MSQLKAIFFGRLGVEFEAIRFSVSFVRLEAVTWERYAHATTKQSSSGSRNRSFKACRTLLGLCIGAIYAMSNSKFVALGDAERSNEHDAK